MSFNEDTRVKIPATVQFLRLGYNYQSLKDAIIDKDTKIFINRFKPTLEQINKRVFTDEEITTLLQEILTTLKNNDLGKGFYNWLINPMDKIKLIDFDDINNNDFAVVNELSFGVTNEGSFRPDITILINGIPLAFLEVKKPNNEGGIQAEFERMISKRFERQENQKYFNMLQFIAFSNNMEYEDDDESDEDPKAGSFYSTPNGFKTSFNFFREEEERELNLIDITEDEVKEILKDNKYKSDEADTIEFKTNMSPDTPCNSFISSVFDMERLLYFINYGMAYVNNPVPEKHIMRYPQFFATRATIEMLENGIKSTILWHCQGSGKTAYSAFTNRVLQDYYGKKGINTRFYFVVDRLDLLNQASNEFTIRGYNAINVDSKEAFSAELNKVLSTNTDMTSYGDFTVVNIHKFSDEIPQAKNDYGAKVQRIIFVDEAHRSYKSAGEFFKNLMLIDDDAIYIALTGTPLLNKKEKTRLKFGGYVHTYFYNKSILDGYTLKIKKETIDTAAKAEIKMNLSLEDPKVDKKTIYESDAYITSLCKFIQNDFKGFRYTMNDKTVGGMIVCSSNNQAKKIHSWFENNSNLITGLVITDDSISNKQKKDTQLAFKKTLNIDILVVHQMLTTGYDVNRLKKMYLLRNAREHTLLQTISRVNRPYKNENGVSYKYGYIVDFVDIEAEYDRTINQYVEELELDMGDEDISLEGLLVGPDDINENYQKYKRELELIVDTTNLEEFSRKLVSLDKDKLLHIRRLLVKIKECYTEFLISRATEYASQIDIQKNKRLLKELQNRINFVNLKTRAVDTLSIISNSEVVDIIYEFIKVRVSIMDLSKLQPIECIEGLEDIVDKFKKIQREIKKNKHKDDIRLVNLDELLKRIFNMLEIVDLNDLSNIDAELLKALEEIKRINEENERLSAVYGGNYAYVKTYNDLIQQHPNYDKVDIESLLVIIHENLQQIVDTNSLIVQGRNSFITNIQQKTTVSLLKQGLYKKLNLKEWFEHLLSDLYVNIQIYK